MDPKMDPKIDPARLILEDPRRIKALQGPSKVQIDQFFIDLRTTYKLKNTASFEVNRTSGGAHAPPPPPARVKNFEIPIW